jgi:hypothetical protein
MTAVAPAPLPRSKRNRCRYRVVGVQQGRFAVVERRTDNIVEAGFDSYEAAWAWIANRLDGRA